MWRSPIICLVDILIFSDNILGAIAYGNNVRKIVGFNGEKI